MLSCHYSYHSLPVSIKCLSICFLGVFVTFTIYLSTLSVHDRYSISNFSEFSKLHLQRVDTGNRIGSVIKKSKLWLTFLPNFNIHPIFEHLFIYLLLLKKFQLYNMQNNFVYEKYFNLVGLEHP